MNMDFDTLILLIGTNPLPNFVVAEYFLKTNPKLKKIILIHSESNINQSGTKDYAESIEKILRIKNPNKGLIFHLCPLSNISQASEIFSDLEIRVKELLESSQSIHLNYTGGTKSMGIHVYRFLLENFSHNTTFSYLDARTFQIVDDREGRVTNDLRKQIKLTISDILALHDFERLNENEKELTLKIYEKAMNIYIDLIKNEKLKEFYEDYKGENFRIKQKLIENAKQLYEKFKELKDYKAKGVLIEINQSLPDNLRLFNPDGSLKPNLTNKTVKSTVKFLDGDWLEYYMFQVLSKFANAHGFTIDLDWEIKKKDWPENTKFQLDLILIKGYQLVGISCTTSDIKKICKGKGFEIFMRTRQIGGEESKAVLVTRLNEQVRSQVEKELQIDTGGTENIRVLGEKDLKEEILIGRIVNFLK